MLSLLPTWHTLLESVGKRHHNHKNEKSKQCMPHGEKGGPLSVNEAQKGLGEHGEKS